ncbi:sigma-70 family RNA polymerase sigma factor [Melioribacter sp. Ez-97]|jgi:RNA polymerase sigma-70 factor (ECF subfamily)|uniref:sigma-70 family RNA polymerase sigma factor n=1 Tax=Melioribacter sp. Ez-97 TaxID=3423434 RepID=UPI003ED87D0B
MASTNESRRKEFDNEITPHIAALKSFALKLSRDPDDAEDLLQDTLLKAFRFFDQYEKGTNVKAWLFQIMKNSFINSYRKIKRQPGKVNYDDIENFYENIRSEEIASSHVQNDAFSDVMSDEIADALAKLPNDFRTIIFLSDIEGYSYEEIADFIDCPVGTVRSRLHRARKMLYTLLYSYAKGKSFVDGESKLILN